jgi:glycosyltransferase involved in cell wall biosynthesis
MRIALVYDAVYPYVKGGAERRYHEIALQLSKHHQVTLVSYGWWGKEQPSDANQNLQYLSVGSPRPLYRVDGTRDTKEAVLFGAAIIPILLRGNFDIVDCCSFPYFSVLSTRLVTASRRIPFVVTWHEHWGQYWHQYWGWKGIFGRMVEQTAVAASPLSISVSDFTRKRLLKGILGRSPKKVVTIPNGIDFERITEVSQSPIPSDVIYVGRLMRHKRLDLLIAAISILRAQGQIVHCRIVGDGPERERLQHLSSELGINSQINFTGFVPENEIYAMMKSARVMVLTSEREGFGNIVLEANCCGIPSIVARGSESASPELVQEGRTGLTCELSTVAIANAISTVLGDPNQFQRDECIDYASGFQWAKVSDQVLEIYESVLSRR